MARCHTRHKLASEFHDQLVSAVRYFGQTRDKGQRRKLFEVNISIFSCNFRNYKIYCFVNLKL